MSQENDTNPEPPSPKELEDKKVQARREEILKLVESKQYRDALNLCFQIISEKDARLLSDALDAIRQVNSDDPALIEPAQLQVAVDFLHSDDDIIRASAVLALKPVLLAKPEALYQMLTNVFTTATSKNGREEAIRLLGLLGTDHPEKVEKLVPEFVACLADDNVHVRKRSLEVLRILSKTAPGKIEKELKKMAGKIADAETLSGIHEVVAEAIKNREMKPIDEKATKEEEKDDLIPDVPPQPKKEGEVMPAPAEAEPPGGTRPEKPILSETEIQKEIGAKIEAEFSKIEEGVKPAPSELKELKEIKSPQDLAPSPAPASVAAKAPEQAAPAAPPSDKEHAPPVAVPGPQDDIAKKQLELKEKELQRREDELKKLELEKKELELQAKELEMQREELKKAQLEQMELEVKRKEEELKQKELALKLKELEEREKNLKAIEKTFQKDE
ncbi:MAG: hypothetical protein JW839_11550 [Candidatus Lokiarchaeota archaeon]|nr:hypothetical protein [Candidatus Lokiarchaeota archaeon]